MKRKICNTEEWKSFTAELSPVQRFTYSYKADAIIAATLAEMDKKPVELLSGYEKLGILLVLGIPVHEEDNMIASYRGVVFTLVDDEYQVVLEPRSILTCC